MPAQHVSELVFGQQAHTSFLRDSLGSRMLDAPRNGHVERSAANKEFPWSLWFLNEN